jgi:23S rRNA (uracil1939-C5)-methyltransferase
VKLRIEKAIYGGDGLARIPEGKAVFVPGTLPGEHVEAAVTDDRRGFATAKLQTILEPSAERVVPGCEYVPRCGGCQYQHAGSAYQLRMKLDILKETLTRAHVPPPPAIGSVAGEPWGYRNRIRLHAKGKAIGYRRRGSHDLLPVTHCPIAASLLEQAIAAVSGVGDLADEVEFFTNGDQILVSLWPERSQRVHERDLEVFAERLQAKIPALAGVGVFSPQSRTWMYWGERSLTCAVLEQRYQVSLGSFFQVNRFLLPKLVDLVTGRRSGRLAWDLYSGVGLFARALNFEKVTAVESEGFSAGDLKKNLDGTPHRVIPSPVLEFLRSTAKAKRIVPELIVVDPPRAGLGKEVCAHLARVAAPNIIYVSCDPATLARDLQALLQSGYSLQAITLVDLFPQTFHLETVTVLTRG